MSSPIGESTSVDDLVTTPIVPTVTDPNDTINSGSVPNQTSINTPSTEIAPNIELDESVTLSESKDNNTTDADIDGKGDLAPEPKIPISTHTIVEEQTLLSDPPNPVEPVKISSTSVTPVISSTPLSTSTSTSTSTPTSTDTSTSTDTPTSTSTSTDTPTKTTQPRSSSKPKEATPEVRFWIYGSLAALFLLATVLLFVSTGLWDPATKFVPLYIIGYRIFYIFFPHDWVKEKYYMSHLHLGLVLILGLIFMPVTQLSTDVLCVDSTPARHINMNSIGYFVVDTLVLIDTLWITHHFFSIGCALFGIAGVNQVLGGSVYVWYAEIGGLLYHISRIWPDSKIVREIFLVFYFVSRLCMLWIASISWRCTLTMNVLFSSTFFVDLVLSCFTTGVALVNMKFLYVNYRNYIKKFRSQPTSIKKEQ